MKGVTVFAVAWLLAIPAGSPVQPAPVMTEVRLDGGIVVKHSPLKYSLSVSSGRLEARGDVVAYGGTGTVHGTRGLVGARTLHIVLKDADVAEVVALLGDAVPIWLKNTLKGKVGCLTIDVAGDEVELKATRFRIHGDPVQRIEATADLKTRKYKANIYALGGLAMVEGKLPE